MLVSHILRSLSAQKDKAEHSPLPSIRAMARHYRVSAFTVQRALARLSGLGTVYALPGKGYFWGAAPPPPSPPPAPAISRPRAIEALFLDEIRSGYLDPFARVPSLKILAERYLTSTRTMSKVLSALAAKGVLGRRGRGYSIADRTAGKGNRVILVTRCDSGGRLLLDSDREVDFLKAVYRETRDLDLDLEILGFDRDGRLLDRHGGKASPDFPGRNLLGFLVSTWLIPDAQRILRLLARRGQPLSVWWEHPSDSIRKARRPRGNIAYFNLAFGERPGAMVAESLLAQGHTDIAYISPFHLSSWSRERLRGLQARLRQAGRAEAVELTDDSHASPWSFQHEAWMASRSGGRAASIEDPRVLRAADRELSRRILSLIRRLPENRRVTAWVCVNDQVADIAAGLARGNGSGKPPYLISFDNSVVSYRRQIDSFAFNTDAMVREMLHHLTHPSSRVFSKQAVIEIAGGVVRK